VRIADEIMERIHDYDTHLVIGELGSGKTTLLGMLAGELSRIGGSVLLINAYSELGGYVKEVRCGYGEPRVLLVDDADALFMAPRLSLKLMDRILGWQGTRVLALTIPIPLVGSLELLEPLIRKLSGSPRYLLDGEVGLRTTKANASPLGIFLRNFRGRRTGITEGDDFVV
jgi:energy-coupling factor transporter ATP-binding protein EcfA2